MSLNKDESWIKEAWDWLEQHPNPIMFVAMNRAERHVFRLCVQLAQLIWECKARGFMVLPPEFEKYKDIPEFKELLKIWGITLNESK